jgi:hypothetical protein
MRAKSARGALTCLAPPERFQRPDRPAKSGVASRFY